VCRDSAWYPFGHGGNIRRLGLLVNCRKCSKTFRSILVLTPGTNSACYRTDSSCECLRGKTVIVLLTKKLISEFQGNIKNPSTLFCCRWCGDQGSIFSRDRIAMTFHVSFILKIGGRLGFRQHLAFFRGKGRKLGVVSQTVRRLIRLLIRVNRFL